MGTSATPASEPAEVEEEVVDELTGEELFDIPDDLLDEPDTEDPAGKPADTATAEPPAGKPDADIPRGPDGKFAKKDATAAPAGQPPEGAPAAGAPAIPGTKPEGVAAAALPAEPPITAPTLEFSFRADGKPITVPGSKVTDEGVFIPREHMAEIQRYLSHGVVYQGSFRQRLEEANAKVAAAENRVTKEVEESKHFLTFFADLLEKGPDAIQQWLDDFTANRRDLEADAKIAYAEALTNRKEKPVLPEKVAGFDEPEDDFLAGIDRDEMMTQLSNVLATNLKEVIVENTVRGMTDADVNRLHKAIASDPEEMERYFAVATEDIPDMKVKKGDVLVRQAALLKRVQYEAAVVSEARKAVSDASAADAANKKRAGGGAPPPTAAVAGAGAAGKKAVPIPKTREELDAFMDAED